MDRGFYLFFLLLIDSVCDNNCVHSLLPRQATISQLPIIMAFFKKKKKRRKNKNYGALPFFFKQKLFLLFFEFQSLGGLFID